MRSGNEFRQAIEVALASQENAPRILDSELGEYSWFGSVDVIDGPVVWRFICERAVLRLEAAPSHSAEQSFDADLLRRLVMGYGYEQGSGYPDNSLTKRALSVLLQQFAELRRPVASSFEPSVWTEPRERLVRLGQLRDHELFRRPLPDERS